MHHLPVRRVGVSCVWLALLVWPLSPAPAAQQPPAAPSAAASVPKDLTPLLVGRVSEMRIPVQWYTADRQTLSQNYLPGSGGAGGRAGGGGRGGQAPAAAPTTPPVVVPSLSPHRLARLKRLDLDWQLALTRIDPAGLSTAGGPTWSNCGPPSRPTLPPSRATRKRSPPCRRSCPSRAPSSTWWKRESGSSRWTGRPPPGV